MNPVSRETKYPRIVARLPAGKVEMHVQLFTASWHALSAFRIARGIGEAPPYVICFDQAVYVLRDQQGRTYRYQSVPFVFLRETDEVQTLSPMN